MVKADQAFNKMWLVVLALLMLIMLPSVVNTPGQAPIKNGELDLSQWQPKASVLKLNGSWQFIWKQLVSPEDLSSLPKSTISLQTIPGTWSEYSLPDMNGTKLPSKGYATYILKLKGLSEDHKTLAGYPAGYIRESYRIYLVPENSPEESRLIMSNGHVAMDGEDAAPSSRAHAFSIPILDPKQDHYLVMHISNHISPEGGLHDGFLIGDENLIHRQVLRSNSWIHLFFGGIGFLAIFNFSLFLQRREDLGSLFLSLYAISQIARNLGTEFLWVHYFANDSTLLWWSEFNMRMVFLSTALGNTLFISFLHYTFKEQSSDLMHKFIWFITGQLCLFIMITSPEVFMQHLGIIVSIGGLLWLLASYILIKAIISGNPSAKISLTGHIILIFTLLNDILVAFSIYSAPYLGQQGLILFVFLQSQVVGMRHATIFKAATERLTLAKSLAAAQEFSLSFIGHKEAMKETAISEYYKAAEMAGGDWLGVIQDEKNHRLFLMAGDVTGHGLESALLTVAVAGAAKGTVATLAKTASGLSLGECLLTLSNAINIAILDASKKSNKGVSMAFICIDTFTGEGAYLNAGHNSVFHITRKKVGSLLLPGSILGTAENPSFKHRPFKLEPGDTLFLYTDGLIENSGPNGDRVSTKKLRQIMTFDEDVSTIKNSILNYAQSIWQDKLPEDDCSFLLVKWQEPQKNEEEAI